MRTRSPHHSDVFSQLPVALMRALDTEAVAELLERLLAAGWRAAQLRHRVGSAPAQGDVARDADHLLALLQGLLQDTPPDVAHAREVEERERTRAWERAHGPTPAAPEVKERAIAQIRSSLKGAPRRPREAAPRTLPPCRLCDGEGAYFVTHEVRLCRRCVAVLATGQARLSDTG